ncbi:S8 family peptidase [Actinoplanes sp. NPDC051411]|uniref:S8 family peptidase n=1 Tax=Actinoplanes sp. NPDC051411 TaxID=3155522 RepID=UPI003411F892
MKNPLRRYAVGALALGAVAGGTALGLHATAPTWQPVTYGLHETPAQLLPATVSTAHPVRVVSTKLGQAGRPVVSVHTATDRSTAAKLVKQGQSASRAVGVELDAVVSAAAVPTGSDPYRGQQWDLAKVGAGDAWAKSTGAGVTVAVIDSGVDASHPDLASHVLPGYDVIAGKAGTSTDPFGHGTHVAGTIAAVTGNGIGVASLAPDTRILPIKVLGADGTGYMSDTATGIIYAADHGANVINMSLGATTQVAAVTNAISYARGKGVVVVAAAGNYRGDGSPTTWPGADPGVIAVAATDANDKVASFSNAGSYVDVAAPGVGIESTYPVSLGNYASMSGTSMASPHVAALAALIKAYRPALSPDQVEKAIETSALDLGTTGRDNDYGYGRINAPAALAAAATLSPAPATSSATPSPSVKTSSPATAPTKEPSTSPAPSKTATPTPTRTVTPTPTKTVTPAPTKPVAKIRPVVTLTPASQTVVAGTTATVTFTVTASGKPWAEKPVKVCVTLAGAAATCTTAETTATGLVPVSFPATGKTTVQLTVAETGTSVAVTSAAATVTVRTQATLTRTGPGALTATVAGAAGQTVQLQRLDGGRWLPVTTYRAAATHAFSGLLAGRAYRLVVPATATLSGATSTNVTA